MPDTFYAHSGDKDDRTDWQPLKEHLEAVAALAERFAREACPGDNELCLAARAAGLLHDLGKYRVEFQQMIRKIQVQKEKTYHKQAGAIKSAMSSNNPIAFAIAGHHGGIPDVSSLMSMVRNVEDQDVLKTTIWPDATLDLPVLKDVAIPPMARSDLSTELLTRLLFSCLVDADWTDTGEHDRQRKGWPKDPPLTKLDASGWLERVLNFVAGKTGSDERIKQIRSEVLDACLNSATEKPGLFSLTVPTGGGKTLSGLAFALKHAAMHGQRRIIYVAPYLSILDQNANVIRDALGFGKDAVEVLEHHSLSDPPVNVNYSEPQQEAAARRAENWDAPVVITTSVQFYESLFSNKPGRCRKLHNIAGSVILLDECQTLPPQLVAPTCAMLKQLTTLGCSIVFCTATQPAFDHEGLEDCEKLHAKEIIPANLELFPRLKRVNVEWPTNKDEVLAWSEVAARMRKESAALCVVNSKQAARELFAELKNIGGDVFHLSTSMCPAHRLEILDQVKKRLRKKKPVYLVSTQLIEAGVDIDFPFVLREMGPLEAIIQASGRCNREGLLSGGGRVVVFRSKEALAEPKKYYPPDRWYKAGRDKVEQDFLGDVPRREPRIDVPGDIQDYFKRLYHSGDLDEKDIQKMRASFQFESVAQAYSLIDDDGVPVVVTLWQGRESEIQGLLDDVRLRPCRAAYRKLARYQVNVRRNQLADIGRLISDEIPGLFVYHGSYDEQLGLTGENTDLLLIV